MAKGAGCSKNQRTDPGKRTSNRRSRSSLLFLVSLLLWACAPSEGEQELVSEYSLLALGTVVSLSVFDAPAGFSTDTLPSIERHLREDEHRWRSFGNGELGQINDLLARGDCAQLSDSTRELLLKALTMQRLSTGLFDPALGIDVDRHGFRDSTQTPQMPPPATTPAAQLSINADRVCTSHPARIDLGGIAKGAIVQQLATLLRESGIHNAIINAGGDLQVLGTRGKQPWRIAIQHPRKAQVVASLPAAAGDAWFTSGDYFRYAETDNNRTHHILDPRTRQPSTRAVAVTVISDDPILADAAATALMVAGPELFGDIARRMGVSRAVLIDRELNIHQWPDAALDLPASLPRDASAAASERPSQHSTDTAPGTISDTPDKL